jgi:tetratricopeptide (TPR) repeat protein
MVSQASSLCQNPFRYSTIPRSYSIPYHGNSGFRENYGCDILEELAKDILKPPYMVHVTIGFREEIILKPEGPSRFKTAVTVSDFRLSGDLSYRSFSISEFLKPRDISLNLKVAARIDTGEYTMRTFGPAPLRMSDKLVFVADSVAADTAADTLISGDYRFFYGEDEWKRFNERKNFIDDYYASSAMLDSLQQEAVGWDMTSQRDLPYNYIRLSELNRFLSLVRDRNFDSCLTRDGGDPKGLSGKYLRLFKISKSCLFNLKEAIEKSGHVTGYGTADSVSGYFVTRLSRYITLSSLLENINGKIYHDYLTAYYDRQVLNDESGMVNSMLIRMFPDAKQDTLLAWASENMLGAYCRKAEELIGLKRYSEAFLLIENARCMVRNNPSLKQGTRIEGLFAKSVNGIYSSYTGIAASSFDAGNILLATEYLSKAEKYAGTYPSLISSDTSYRRIYRSILLGRLGNCDRLLENGGFEDALDCIKAFELSYSGSPLGVLTADLDEKMNRARTGIIMDLLGKTSKALKMDHPDSALDSYDRACNIYQEMPENLKKIRSFDSLALPVAIVRYEKINALAEAYCRRRQFARAILQFEQASQLAETYGIQTDRTADSLYISSYRQWLLDQISGEQKLVWNNQSDSAKKFLESVVKTAERKGLSEDPDIVEAVSSYRLMMKNQACSLLEDSLNLLSIRAGKSFAIRNFIRGAGLLKQAIRIAEHSPWCSFDTRPIRDTLASYDVAAKYQKRYEDAAISIAAGDFEPGIRILATNEQYYTFNRIDNFGIPLVSVYDFVVMKGNPVLSAFALDYYVMNNNPVEALRYLILMEVQGLKEDRSLPYQEKLARIMAARDKLVYGKTDPQSLLKQYTSSNPWMNRFSSVYLMEWKK